jgi:hypothetical protein
MLCREAGRRSTVSPYQPTAEVSMMGHAQHDFYKVNSLTNFDTASPVEGKIVWDAPRRCGMARCCWGPSCSVR